MIVFIFHLKYETKDEILNLLFHISSINQTNNQNQQNNSSSNQQQDQDEDQNNSHHQLLLDNLTFQLYEKIISCSNIQKNSKEILIKFEKLLIDVLNNLSFISFTKNYFSILNYLFFPSSNDKNQQQSQNNENHQQPIQKFEFFLKKMFSKFQISWKEENEKQKGEKEGGKTIKLFK